MDVLSVSCKQVAEPDLWYGVYREQGSLLQKQVARMAASYNTGARNPKNELRNITVTCRRVRTTSGNLPTE
jgi:hypothetical protein